MTTRARKPSPSVRPSCAVPLPTSFGNLERGAYSSVSIDDRAAAYQATSYLIDQGHTKIAVLLDTIHDRSISELRYMGFCQALEDRGAAC